MNSRDSIEFIKKFKTSLETNNTQHIDLQEVMKELKKISD